MPNADFDDNIADMANAASDSSTENDATEDSGSVSEDEQTPEDSTDDTQAGDDAEESDDEDSDSEDSDRTPAEKNVPFHKNPRFRQLNAQVKELKEQLESERVARQEAERLQNATPEEKAVHELIHKYGLAPKSELDKVNKTLAAMKDAQDFEKFLDKHPEAAGKAEALKALAYTPTYLRASYEEIYNEVFNGTTPGGDRKVVKRRVRNGIKPIGNGGADSGKDSAHVYTRAELRAMDEKTYEKNRNEIQKQMKEGLIK